MQAMLAAGVAPAIAKAASLMPVRMLESGVLVPEAVAPSLMIRVPVAALTAGTKTFSFFYQKPGEGWVRHLRQIETTGKETYIEVDVAKETGFQGNRWISSSPFVGGKPTPKEMNTIILGGVQIEEAVRHVPGYHSTMQINHHHTNSVMNSDNPFYDCRKLGVWKP